MPPSVRLPRAPDSTVDLKVTAKTEEELTALRGRLTPGARRAVAPRPP